MDEIKNVDNPFDNYLHTKHAKPSNYDGGYKTIKKIRTRSRSALRR